MIQSSFSQKFQGFQKGCFGENDPIYEWLEEYYLEIFFFSYKFQPYLIFCKITSTKKCMFNNNLQCLYDHCSNQQAKLVDWLKLAIMIYISTNRKDI